MMPLADTFLDCLFFGQVFALFGFAIIAGAGFPILPAPRVDPNLITIQRRLRTAGRSKPRDGRIRTDVRFIRFNPVCSDSLLGCLEVELPATNQLMELAFQSVF